MSAGLSVEVFKDRKGLLYKCGKCDWQRRNLPGETVDSFMGDVSKHDRACVPAEPVKVGEKKADK